MPVKLPVVSWAGPLEAAQKALTKASDLLALGRESEGMEQLAELQEQLNAAVAFIVKQTTDKERPCTGT
jgi:hypothetical protein